MDQDRQDERADGMNGGLAGGWQIPAAKTDLYRGYSSNSRQNLVQR
jgi:hypothetical protein